jgi:hypothetical protein
MSTITPCWLRVLREITSEGYNGFNSGSKPFNDYLIIITIMVCLISRSALPCSPEDIFDNSVREE